MPPQAPVTPWPSVLTSSPLDTESFLVSPSPTVKFSVGSRKGSLYNWTPPSTPSFRERYYLVSGPHRTEMLWTHAGTGVGGGSPGAGMWGGAGQPCTSPCSKLWVQPPLFWVILGVFLYFLFLDVGSSILGGAARFGWFSRMPGIRSAGWFYPPSHGLGLQFFCFKVKQSMFPVGNTLT